jgi:hypothetical protein
VTLGIATAFESTTVSTTEGLTSVVQAMPSAASPPPQADKARAAAAAARAVEGRWDKGLSATGWGRVVKDHGPVAFRGIFSHSMRGVQSWFVFLPFRAAVVSGADLAAEAREPP